MLHLASTEKDFWDIEVREKAMLFMTKLATVAQTVHDGTILNPSGSSYRSFQDAPGGRPYDATGKGKGGRRRS